MQNVGFIGWRGMVGSVLMDRMVQENDFANINPVFFTTSQAGQKAPVFAGKDAGELKNAFDIEDLAKLDIIVTCQGETTPMKSIQNYVRQAGTVIGLMQLLHCVWKKMRSSY